MNAKKLLALLLALVLCIGTLAACGTEPAETTAPASQGTTAPAADTTAPAVDTTEAAPLTNAERYPIDFDGTLTCVTSQSNATEAHNYLLWEELTGVDVDWKITAAEQVPLIFLDEKQMPDMFFNAGGISAAQINEYGQGGLLINYMDYLDKMPNLAARYAEDPMLFSAVKDSYGNVYALPYYCYTLTTGGNLFYIRLDMTAEAGWDTLPSTVEDFLLLCEDLKNTYADVEGYIPMVSSGPTGVSYTGAYCTFFFPAFGELMEAGLTTTLDGTTVAAGFATEQFKYYLQFMNTLYEKGYLDPECFVAENNTTQAMMIDKFTSMHPSATFLTKDNFASGEMDFQVMPPMTSQYQSEARSLIPNRYRGSTYLISSSCKDLDAALAFMDAMYAVEEDPLNEEGTAWGMSLWLGEVGEDIEIDKEAGSYVILPHEGFDASATWLGVAGHGGAAYLDWPYYENSGTGLMVKAIGRRDILNAVGVSNIPVGFLTLTQEEQDIHNDCWTDILNKVTEMNAAFITGQADIEAEWDSYISTLYDMGLQDSIDVYQAALDRFNAT